MLHLAVHETHTSPNFKRQPIFKYITHSAAFYTRKADRYQIPTRQLGRDGPLVSSIGFGTTGIGGAWYGKANEETSLKTLSYAADRGMTFWDSSDIYGTSEAIIGRWFKETGRRGEIFLATKSGSFDPENTSAGLNPISTPSYIKYALQRSLSHPGTDYIDLYYQHRVDPNVPIEIVLETLCVPFENGTIRWISLSECSADVLRRARAVPGIGKRVVACQMEYSPFEQYIVRNGFVKVAEEEGVAVVAYSPLGRGMISGRYHSRADFKPGDLRLDLPRFDEGNFAKNLELVDKFKNVADKYGATQSQVALAWILAEHPNFIPIPGCRFPSRIEENAHAAEITLEPQDVLAIRTLVDTADVRGERYPAKYVRGSDCIPLAEWKGE